MINHGNRRCKIDLGPKETHFVLIKTGNLWTVGPNSSKRSLLPDYMAQEPRRQSSSYSPPEKLKSQKEGLLHIKILSQVCDYFVSTYNKTRLIYDLLSFRVL
jgi:hypothetical protein